MNVSRFTIAPAGLDTAPAHVETLLAGAATVDVTPPPGMPKAGFSKNAHDGTGFRSRLRARVLHLRRATTSIALVQSDLFSGSSLLQHLVAQAVAERTDVRLPGVWIGATHTHAGPGQFDASPFYNRFASNRPGFDPAWTAVLTERIAGAVVEAVETRRPARLAVGRTEVWGMTRNRSLAPHLRNRTVTDKSTAADRKFSAVNPWLTLVRVDAAAADGGYEPLAAMLVFAIHGTGISMDCEQYHADVWGHMTQELGAYIRRSTGHDAVVGAVTGTHADCAPAIRPGRAGFIEAERVGRGIGAAACPLYDRLEGELTDRVTLGAGLRELDLDHGGDSIEGIQLGTPLLGAAQVAGAMENLTPGLRLIPPFRAGYPKPFRSRSPHGRKWVLGTRWLQHLYLPTDQFPRVLTIQVLRIGEHALVGAPFELTVETGRRIADAVETTGIGTAVVSSLANGYCGYCTTAEEYELQYYEGGHNLHGPATQAWIAAQAARLAGEVAKDGDVADVLAVRSFALPVRRYLPRAVGGAPPRRSLGPPSYVDPAGEEYGYWEQRWTDAAPGDLRWDVPMVRVDVEDGRGGWLPAVDDQGWEIGVTHEGGSTYAARWYDPAVGGGPRHRFVVLANGRREELVC